MPLHSTSPTVLRLSAALAALFMALPLAVRADALSAAAAHAALARGALAWDVRAAPATLIPGAAQATSADMQRWLQGQGAQWLERAVSAAGIDLSREVILYGAAGDAQAQALHDALARRVHLAGGRVHWLVGGIDEWQAAGLPTAAQPAQRLPVPQHLVLRPAAGEALEMAAPALRRSQPPAAALAATANAERG